MSSATETLAPTQQAEGAGAQRPESLSGRLAAALRTRRARIRVSDIVVFVRHLATLLNAGLPLSKSLQTVARQLENPSLSDVVAELAEAVRSGEMLSDAMARKPRVFDPLTVNIIRAGEVGGNVAATLQDLAADLEKKDALRRAVKAAMIYPMVVVSIASLVVAFLLVYIVPSFQDVYRKMHLELPLATRILLLVSAFLTRYWWVVVVVIPAVVVGRRRLMRIERVQRAWEKFVLRLPMLGKIRRGAIAARFLSTFATLVGSGVSIVESLRLMSTLADSTVVRDAIDDIRRHVSRGGTIGRPMERYADLFSPMAIQMVVVGEQTGSLPEAASRTASYLAEDVDNRVKTLTTLIEPMLTLGLGVIVGTIALAIYLPMFDLMKHITR